MRAERLRILHLITRLPVGGAERLLVDVVRRLDPTRFESRVCCIQAKGELADELEAAGTPVLCLGRMQSKRFDWRVVADLRRLLLRERISLVHSHLYHANLYGRLAAILAGTPAVASVHNVYARPKWHRRLVNGWLARRTARVIAVSEEVRRDVLAHDSVDPARVVTIRNGVDLRRVSSALTREQARARLSLAEGVLAIGCVGRLEEQKGHRYLLEACALLAQQLGFAAFRVIVVGDGRLRASLQQQATELDLADRVSFLGSRKDVGDILKALDVYAMPSLWEGLPVAMLEAMAAGLPIVISDVGGVAEAIDAASGIRVPPKDPRALADALHGLATQPERRRSLGAAARARVESEFSGDAMIARLSRMYEEACASS